MKTHELDTRLRAWAAAADAGAPDTTATLVPRVQAALRRECAAGSVPAHAGGHLEIPVWLGRLGWATAGVAIGLLIGVLWLRSPSDSATAMARQPADDMRWPGNGQGEPKAGALAGQLTALFGPALNGYVETSRDLTLALASQAAEPASKQWVRVEFALFRRAGAGAPWQSAWHAAAVVRAEERVELRTDGGTQLVLWALPVNGDAVLVESEMDLKLPRLAFRHEGSDLCQRGRPSRMLQFDDETGTFRLMIRAQTTSANAPVPEA